jgi:hypothetical protein
MRLLGAKSIAELGPQHVCSSMYSNLLLLLLTQRAQINTRIVEQEIYDGKPNLGSVGLWSKAKL